MNRKLKAKIVENYGSQADFAQAMSIDETLVSRIVRGRRILDESKKKAWAQALNCSPHEIFGRVLYRHLHGQVSAQLPTIPLIPLFFAVIFHRELPPTGEIRTHA